MECLVFRGARGCGEISSVFWRGVYGAGRQTEVGRQGEPAAVPYKERKGLMLIWNAMKTINLLSTTCSAIGTTLLYRYSFSVEPFPALHSAETIRAKKSAIESVLSFNG